MRLVAPLSLVLATACATDPYVVFWPKTTDAYRLPGNHVPAHLIERPVIVSEDGLRLGAVMAWQEERGTRPSILYLHGRAEHIDDVWGKVQRLWDGGYQVLAVDYRGYGTSEGVPSEAGLYVDAAAAWAWLAGMEELDAGQLLVWGYSLGGAVAAELATHVDEAGLILVAPFTSMRDVVRESAPMRLPAAWITETRFDTIERIGEVGSSVLLVYGTEDGRIPSWMPEALYERAREPKALVRVAGAGHESVFDRGIDEILAVLGAMRSDRR